MIDRIEALRDDANANDTSIRLKPEALGRVDVSLRTHADGAVSVHFAAEQPATRTLLADAAPQLNAAAEARGIRLAGTSVDLSGSGMTGGDRPRPQVELQQNVSNHLAASGGDDIQAVADGRIA
jgi:flagellar hook-length control protein FliK